MSSSRLSGTSGGQGRRLTLAGQADEFLQLAHPLRVAELAQGLGLDPADLIPGCLEIACDLLQRACVLSAGAEPLFENLALALRQGVKDLIQDLPQPLVHGSGARWAGAYLNRLTSSWLGSSSSGTEYSG